MKVSKQFVLTLITVSVAGLVASGCNTFKGAGRDIQKGGEAIEGAAEEVQDGK
jgi:predicted small secreted protein